MDSTAPGQLKRGEQYKWCAVYTKSRAEKKVLKELVQKGIECYLPLKTVKRQWKSQSRLIEIPLITCYLFVRISRKEYYDVLVTPGVMRYVCFDGVPAVIPDHQIEALEVFMREENERVEVTSDDLTKGDLVRVIEGPLKDIQAEVVQIRGKRRIVLRFRSLGCYIHVDLGDNKIEILRKVARNKK